jgi:hypothetical protein
MQSQLSSELHCLYSSSSVNALRSLRDLQFISQIGCGHEIQRLHDGHQLHGVGITFSFLRE